LRLAPVPVAHHLPTDTRPTDPDLALVIERWADLPEAVRAGITAMVRAAGKGRRPVGILGINMSQALG
jgi:hypothetical protein